MKFDDLFKPTNICYEIKINEAKRTRRDKQRENQGRQSTTDTNSVGMGGFNTIPAMDGEGRSQTGDSNAEEYPKRRAVDGMVPISPQTKCQVDPAESLYPTISEIAISIGMEQSVLDNECNNLSISNFKNGQIPFTMFGTDKESGINSKNEIIRPFRDDNHWHCHLDSSGDPMIAYRVISPNQIRLICITTHRLNFVERKTFIKKFASEFPKTIKRRPNLGK